MSNETESLPLNVEGIKALAKALGINSHSELARRCDIERTYLFRILDGQRPVQPSHIVKIARGLKVAPIALVGTDDPALLEAIARAEAVA